MKKRIVAIVPAFNEEENIRVVIKDLRMYQPEIKIVVINDCSGDNTEAIVNEMSETVLSLPINLGIGGAVQTGLRYARDNGFDIAIQFDGDGQHMAEEIEKIITPVINSEADVVNGSRFLGAGGYKSNFLRRVGIRLFMLVNSLMIGSRITDNTSGFRAFNSQAISFLACYYPQDYPEPQAIIELYRNKFRIKEVAVAMKERTRGSTSIKALSSVYYMVKVLMANFIAFTREPVIKERF